MQTLGQRAVLFFVAICVTCFHTSVEAACGGGCISSNQCAQWAHDHNCRCTWFTCGDVSADDPRMKDVEMFDEFIKEYSGNPRMLASAAVNAFHAKGNSGVKQFIVSTVYEIKEGNVALRK